MFGIHFISTTNEKIAKCAILGASPKWSDLGGSHRPKSCGSN